MNHRVLVACNRMAALILAAFAALGAQAQSGTIEFSSRAYSVKESGGAAKITVSRVAGSAGTVTVDFRTMDGDAGTATANQDYFPTNGTLTFGPGVTSQFFYVPIIDDMVHETNETVILELQGDPRVLGQTNTATLTIIYNDPCQYSLSPTSQTLDSGGGLAPAITVAATEGCVWTASSSVTWIGIQPPGQGSGTGQVVYSYDPNPSANPRTATLTIAGKRFAITQGGVPPPDLTPPAVTILSPAANSRQTNTEITVTGRATDNVGVSVVEVRLENAVGAGDYVQATGTANWAARISGLLPGTNTIRVRARDADNAPTEVTRPVFYVEVRPLTLATNGGGSVTPLVNGQLLDVGKNYTVRAKPATKHFFTGWSGTVESTFNPLSFEMQADMMLQANFVLSPFIAVAGTYNGLFLEEGSIRHERSGFLTVRVTDLGAFTAKMNLAGRWRSLSGKFALDGTTSNSIPRPGLTPITIMLSLDLVSGTDQILGSVGDADWQVNLSADRAIFDGRTHRPIQEGHYTMIVPGNDVDAANQPGGDSFGAVTVDANGSVKLTATLADGTKVTQRAPLSKNGLWPLYASLYRGNGSILSRVSFADSLDSDFTGNLTWVRPAMPNAKFYPTGFGLQRDFSGSGYSPPTNNTDRLLTFSDGKVQFSAGNLTEPFENPVSLASDNKVTNLGPNKLTLTISRPTGLFYGNVTLPGTNRSLPFTGAVHRKGDYGAGFFLGTSQSGRVHLGE